MSELPFKGQEELFKRSIGTSTVNNFIARLYSNSRTPAQSDTIASYTEITGGGYAEIEILSGDWTVTSVSGHTVMSANVEFVMTSAVAVIYGFYITDNLNTKLFHAEIFNDAPITIGGGGGSVEVTINIQLN